LGGHREQANIEGNALAGESVGRAETDGNVAELAPNLDFFSAFELDLDLFPELQTCQQPFGDTANIDDMMRNLFDGFIPSIQIPN